MDIAVITGASSGLGAEYVRQVVRQLPHLDEIWLIARRTERLLALTETYPQTKFRCLSLDLCRPECLEEYRTQLRESKARVVLLINNAGCGKLGKVEEQAPEEQAVMIDLNCRALTEITTVTLPSMERGGHILNVCSIASYVPNPRLAVYSATKAYVASLTHALQFELKPRGIHVLAVCPGPMKTEFLEVAAITGNSHAFDTLPYCRPEQVAERSLTRLLHGKGWYTPRLFYKFYRVVAKLLPASLLMHLSKA